MSEVKFFYVREKSNHPANANHRGKPVACIASKVEQFTPALQFANDPVGLKHIKITYALAIANESEEFLKPRAREIAGGRVRKSKTRINTVYVQKDNLTSVEVTRAILLDICNSVYLSHGTGSRKMPVRVREAAKAWLTAKDSNG